MPRLSWAMLLCLSVDFSNPMLPGTVRFDPSQSIEAVQGGVVALLGASSLAPARPPDRRAVPPRSSILPPGSAPVAPPGWRWYRIVRPARHPSDGLTTAFSSEDG